MYISGRISLFIFAGNAGTGRQVARLQRWRTVAEGPQYLKIVGKVLYRLTDSEADEEAGLIRKVF